MTILSDIFSANNNQNIKESDSENDETIVWEIRVNSLGLERKATCKAKENDFVTICSNGTFCPVVYSYFSANGGILDPIDENSNENEFFERMLPEDLLELVVRETNRYHQLI